MAEFYLGEVIGYGVLWSHLAVKLSKNGLCQFKSNQITIFAIKQNHVIETIYTQRNQGLFAD